MSDKKRRTEEYQKRSHQVEIHRRSNQEQKNPKTGSGTVPRLQKFHLKFRILSQNPQTEIMLHSDSGININSEKGSYTSVCRRHSGEGCGSKTRRDGKAAFLKNGSGFGQNVEKNRRAGFFDETEGICFRKQKELQYKQRISASVAAGRCAGEIRAYAVPGCRPSFLRSSGLREGITGKGEKGMRILLAEDERALSRVLTAILTRNRYSVDAVYDGEAAYESVKTGLYDGVILDIMMPKMDGLTVLRKVREDGDLVPVLILSAKAEVGDKVSGLDGGADDYLTKPFSSEELLARLRAMIRDRQDVSQPLSVGNITLYRYASELASPFGSLFLSDCEVRLMELLMCSCGYPVPAQRLKEKAGAKDGEEEIRLYIAYLRKKLEILHADIEIRSVWENSYILEQKRCSRN